MTITKRARDRRKRHDISDLDQLEALASPVRHQIHQALDAIGPASVRELAHRLGRQPEALYYHVRELLRVGLIVEKEKRKTVRRAESIFDVVGRPFRIDPKITSPAFLDAIVRSCAARLRLAERGLERSITSEDAVRQGPLRTWRMEQNQVRLGRESLRQLNAKIDDLVEFLRQHDDPEASHVFTVSVAAAR